VETQRSGRRERIGWVGAEVYCWQRVQRKRVCPQQSGREPIPDDGGEGVATRSGGMEGCDVVEDCQGASRFGFAGCRLAGVVLDAVAKGNLFQGECWGRRGKFCA